MRRLLRLITLVQMLLLSATAPLATAADMQSTPVEPAVTAGTILTPIVNVTRAPGLPEVGLTVENGLFPARSLQIQITSPSGRQFVFANVNFNPLPAASSNLTLKVQQQSSFAGPGPAFLHQGFGLYSEPGIWSVSQITLVSVTGNIFPYGGSQLAALFHGTTTFTVRNPATPDTVAPTAGTGTILTPAVKLSGYAPYAAIRLNVGDFLSGVASVSATFYQASYPRNPPLTLVSNLFSPVRNGTVTALLYLPPTTPPDTYLFKYFTVCDVAGNCTSDSPATHFPTTLITITQ